MRAGADDARYEDSENESVRLVFVWMLMSSAMVFQFYSRLSNQKKHESTTQTDCTSARQLFLECTQKGFRNVTWTRPVLPNFDDDALKGQFPINWPKRQPQRNGHPSWSGCRCHCDSQRLTKSTSSTSAKNKKKTQKRGWQNPKCWATAAFHSRRDHDSISRGAPCLSVRQNSVSCNLVML